MALGRPSVPVEGFEPDDSRMNVYKAAVKARSKIDRLLVWFSTIAIALVAGALILLAQ